MPYYHLRISLFEQNEAEGVVSNFCKKFDGYIIKAIFAYECKEDKETQSNHHIHGHIYYDDTIYTEGQKDSPNLSKIKYHLKTKHASKYYHKQITKDPQNNELYVCKELKIIKSVRYTDEEVNDIYEKNQAIEIDKQKDPKQKMIERLKEKHGTLIHFSMNQLLEAIKTVYIIDWDKFPPPQCKALCEYITLKEVTEYRKRPRMRQVPGGFAPISCPLAISWEYHNSKQFQDNQATMSILDWEDPREDEITEYYYKNI